MRNVIPAALLMAIAYTVGLFAGGTQGFDKGFDGGYEAGRDKVLGYVAKGPTRCYGAIKNPKDEDAHLQCLIRFQESFDILTHFY